MTVNQQMFLYAVEEMSFTKAANRGCVTQQCLSNHIHRLEEFYGVRLFDRVPKLALTSAGEILYQSLLEIQNIEESVKQQFAGDHKNMKGEIRFGIHTNRAPILIPDVFSSFRRQFPNVRLSVSLGQTSAFQNQLAEGKLDIALGINALSDPVIQKESICEETVYLLAAVDLLMEKIPGWTLSRTSITAEELAFLPIAGNPEISTLKHRLDAFLADRNVSMNQICSVGDYQTQLLLCKRKQTAFFCPECFLLNSSLLEQEDPGEGRIAVLKIEGFQDRLRAELLSNRQRYSPAYVTAFRELFCRIYRQRLREFRETIS